MPSTRSDAGCRDLSARFGRALETVRGSRLAAERLRASPARHVIALGKAAESLAAGACEALGGHLLSGFAALPHGYATGELPAGARIRRVFGNHPVPGPDSIAAGEALADYVRDLPEGDAVAVLVSGGASACVEWPRPGIDLALLRRANRWLLGGGLSITEINRIRARLSRLKGGGLARLLAGREVRGFILADVPGGNIRWVGGGPVSAVPPGALPRLPDWLRPPAEEGAPVPEVPLERLAGNEEAMAALRDGRVVASGTLEGDAVAMAGRIAESLRGATPGAYVWGGETTLVLPDQPGCGGRCRHLALCVARALAGIEGWRLLAAGTDGWDGTDAVAGACVDGGTVPRGERAGMDADAALRYADSGRFLEASGDAFVTGPTGTNVNDLVIASVARPA